MIPSSADAPITTKPNRARIRELESHIKRNLDNKRPPCAELRIATLGELLWLATSRKWAIGLDDTYVTYDEASVRWFKELQYKSSIPAQLSRILLGGDDLRGVDLRGVDLRGAILVEADLQWARLRGADLQGANLHRALLNYADLSNTDLRSGSDRRSTFTNQTILNSAVLTGANLEGALLTHTVTRDCRLVDYRREDELTRALTANRDAKVAACQGITFRTRNEVLWAMNWLQWSGDPDIGPAYSRADFTGADLSAINFSGIDTIGMQLAGARLLDDDARASFLKHFAERTLSEAPTQGVEIRNSNEALWIMACARWETQPDILRDSATKKRRRRKWRPTRAHYARLQGAIFAAYTGNSWTGDFRGLYLCGANLSATTLEGVDLSAARLMQAHLHRTRGQGARLDKSDMTSAHAKSANFQFASFVKADLLDVDLRHATLTGVHLTEGDLSGARLGDATFDGAQLERAQLASVNLKYATFKQANLIGATLESASAEKADLSRADVRRANLNGISFSGRTALDELTFDARTRFGDTHWDGVSLGRVDWRQARRLGDEEYLQIRLRELDEKYTPAIQKADSWAERRSLAHKRFEERIQLNRDVARVYHILRLALEQQRIIKPASMYRIRELQIQRRIMRMHNRWLSWLFSLSLNLVAGYGERPQWAFFWYLGIVSAFALIDTAIAHFTGPRSFSVIDFLAFSLASFHGRGFFPASSTEIPIQSAITRLAELEAVIGLYLELTFIASFTKRFLS